MTYASTLPCLTTRWHIQNLFQKQNKTPQFFATIYQNGLPDARKLTDRLKWLRPHEKMMMGNDNKTHLECGWKNDLRCHILVQNTLLFEDMNRNWLNFQGELFLPLQTISYKRTKTFKRKTWIQCAIYRCACTEHEGNCYVMIGSPLPRAAARASGLRDALVILKHAE